MDPGSMAVCGVAVEAMDAEIPSTVWTSAFHSLENWSVVISPWCPYHVVSCLMALNMSVSPPAFLPLTVGDCEIAGIVPGTEGLRKQLL